MSHEKVIVIHCHFYQPPRENPWTDEIELQESAHPYHDWNERIANECYTPNTASRILDSLGRIEKVVNNYEHISFNIGPTLSRWLEKYVPVTLERIVAADKKSVKVFGHGNAIAQSFNHMIMPLCVYRDKVTQTIWGKEEFKYRFGRETEGMWLAETACNNETVEVLIEQGIRFLVLSPYQADSVRHLHDGGDWSDVGGGNIDVTVPYRCFPVEGDREKYIDIFFYHAPLSQGVSFEHLLRSAEKFSGRMDGMFSDWAGRDQVVTVCTDGESYGHHEPFGDMAVAYIAESGRVDKGYSLGNFGQFLEKNPPFMEARIKKGTNNEGTSWSCAHGVGRWQDDCGCETGGLPGWNQKWRRPLRDALDWLRGEIDKVCGTEGRKIFKNFWKARNDYVMVMLDPSRESKSKFFKANQLHTLSREERTLGLCLMEIQKDRMYMYTSCGWFFNELSGIETTQILKYAARAIGTISDNFGYNLESKFLELLKKAKSNIPEYSDGYNIYKTLVTPSVVSWRRLLCHFVMYIPFSGFSEVFKMLGAHGKKEFEAHKSFQNFSIVIGKILVTKDDTHERRKMVFALLYNGLDIKVFMSEDKDSSAFKSLLDILDIPAGTDRLKAEGLLARILGKEYSTFRDIFYEKRNDIIKAVICEKNASFQSTYAAMFNENRAIIEAIVDDNAAIPRELVVPTEITLSAQLKEAVKEMLRDDVFTSSRKAISVMHYARNLGVTLDTENVGKVYVEHVELELKALLLKPSKSKAEEIINMLNAGEELFPKMHKTNLENYAYEMITEVIKPKLQLLLKKNLSQKAKYEFVRTLIKLVERLNINMDEYNKSLSHIEFEISEDSNMWP